jgi:hypothetical protein
VAARVLARTIQSNRKLPIQVQVLLPATPTFPSAFRDPGNSQSLITTSFLIPPDSLSFAPSVCLSLPNPRMFPASYSRGRSAANVEL